MSQRSSLCCCVRACVLVTHIKIRILVVVVARDSVRLYIVRDLVVPLLVQQLVYGICYMFEQGNNNPHDWKDTQASGIQSPSLIGVVCSFFII